MASFLGVIALAGQAAEPRVSALAPSPAPPPFCGTMEAWARRNPAQYQWFQLGLNGTCPTAGPCDTPANRDGNIPTGATPFKLVQLRFHVFADDNGANQVATLAQISNQVDRLNADYFPARFAFVHTAHVVNNSTYRFIETNHLEKVDQMKTAYAEDPFHQINCYVIDYGPGNCGVATFPWDAAALSATGGLLLDRINYTNPNFASCISHEMGHMVGLLHTFNGVTEVSGCAGCRELVGRSAADGDLAGDRCSDTAPEPGITDTLPPCPPPVGTNDPCNGLPFTGVNTSNYMSYYVACYNNFTAQQLGRMHCWASGPVSSWLQMDYTQPAIAITSPADGDEFEAFGPITGWATDNWVVQSVTFTLREIDPSGGPSRWWNGASWQDTVFALAATVTGTNWAKADGVTLPPLNSGIYYQIAATATDGQFNTAAASVTVHAPIHQLVWDPGVTHLGTQVLQNPNANGGSYYFKITTLNTANGVWRTALNVQSGEADVYQAYGWLPTTYSYSYQSTRIGSDGFVLSQLAGQFGAGQDWYIMVTATQGAQWNLVSGEAYVLPLPPLAADASSSATVMMGAEGMRFFSTSISSNTLAWRLGLNGLPNLILVKNTSLPTPVSYEWEQAGQMLQVPPYLNAGDQYLVGVVGDPGLGFTLDSRQQAVTDLAFNSATTINVPANHYGYVTFRVQVPIHQIAWQVNAASSVGDANVAVRRDAVANEFVNDAFSDIAGPTADSVTMVPPILSDGTFYITVYGDAPYTCSMTNGQPIITDVHYVFSITNDAPNRTGWRYYRVINTAEQLGTLGWDLFLQNQPPGTEIALRRNAVPGRWNYRDFTWDYYGYYSQGYVDYSGPNGFLQRPGHQADVWYIGVYSPAAALGNFVLYGQQLTGPPLAFDGAGSISNVVNQPVGKYQYYTLTVPNNAQGWDLRLVNVSSGDPRLSVRRDVLPGTAGGGWWYPNLSTSWPTGNEWDAGPDWTAFNSDPNGANEYGHILAMGMGNPLEPGTYYIGVASGSGGDPMSYQIVSRGIGTNLAISIQNLAFTNGVVSSNGLPAREAAYYRVVVPTNVPSWEIGLVATAGETLLALEKDTLPTAWAGQNYSSWLVGGRKLEKAGDEHYLLLPQSGQTNLLAGTYYLAVVGEGVNPGAACGSCIGVGYSSYTLTSYGVPGITNLHTLDATGVSDLTHDDHNAGGAIKTFQFTVPPGTLAMQVWLENHVGNPKMTLRADGQLPGGSDPYGYGYDNGQGATWADFNLINIANPVPTNYTLMVQATIDYSAYPYTYPDASYRIRVHAETALPVSFDGGTQPVINQTAGLWQYFIIHVPSNALGWDLRLTNVTSGDPRLYVCRDLVPPGTYWWYPNLSTTWPSGNEWDASLDWTGDYYEPDGANAYGHILAMGMGNPLEPGTYYVGIVNGSGYSYSSDPMSYTLVSRGIGTNLTIPVMDLGFSGGVAAGHDLPTREAAYYRVVVPMDTPSWELELENTAAVSPPNGPSPKASASMKVMANPGESLLAVEKDALPTVAAGTAYSSYLLGGRKLQKNGHEHYLLLPPYGQTMVLAGTYYLAVVSEGVNPHDSYIGTDASDYTLTSYGVAGITNLGTVDLTGATDIIHTDANEGGAIKTFQFRVPPGTISLEVHLQNQTGHPLMTLRADGQLPGGSDPYGYGYDNGQGAAWTDSALINIANPVPTNYTLMIQAAIDYSVYPYPYNDATYQIRIHALGELSLPFDGGVQSITDQPAGTWQYFLVNVPSNALGWDLRLINVTSGDPRLHICRDIVPPGAYWYYPNLSTSWPSGNEWDANVDWTGYYYGPDGTNEYGHILAMGMGNPLEPGTYYVGIFNGNGYGFSSDPMSYTIASRGIGLSMSIPVTDLSFHGGTILNNALPGREAAYYRVVVPTNMPSWKLRLLETAGESLLAIEKDALPSIDAGSAYSSYLLGGRKMQKAGNEHYLLLPNGGDSNILAGTYYLAVVSEGVNPGNTCSSCIGAGASAYTLTSYGPLGFTNLGTVGVMDLVKTNFQEGGEVKVYQFSIPPGSPPVEVRMENVVGAPYAFMVPGGQVPGARDFTDGGIGSNWNLDPATILTMPSPAATNYTIMAQAYYSSYYVYPDATFTLHIRQMPITEFNFAANLNTNGLTNVVMGTLADNQRAFYKVVVPAINNGLPVLGWRLQLDKTAGTPYVRARKGVIPDDGYYDGTSGFVTDQGLYVAPYLTPGTWYVEVRGSGVTTYTLTSSELKLERPSWQMPWLGGLVTTPGLPPAGQLFGDTGVTPDGAPLPLDQGTDLAQGAFHYYTVIVPANNGGLMRTRLDAISGTPNLYLRVGAPPTLTHDAGGLGSGLYDRYLVASGGSQYGNWVPMDGRHEAYLTPGTWFLAVQAAGGSNVRYRLRLSTGDVQALALDGGSYTNSLVAGDWRYYRVSLPTNAPFNWNVSFSQIIGDVVMYLRDTTPPGEASAHYDLRDWSSDYKNHGPYASYDLPGTYTFNTPPFRPGNTYYVGFRAVNDATFSVSSSTSGGAVSVDGLVPFYGGYTTNLIQGNGSLLFRIDVPPDALSWHHYAVHSANVTLFLEQGTLPQLPGNYDYASYYPNSSFQADLTNPNSWPWLPGYAYFLLVSNASATVEPFSFSMYGYGPNSPPTKFLTPVPQPNGSIQLTFSVNPGLPYELQYSTDLVHWYTLSYFTSAVTPITITDNSFYPPTTPYRFYRLISP